MWIKTNNDILKLKSLMNTFNLTQVINFPTRINANNCTLKNPIFVCTSIFTIIHVEPFINGLSDHDAQIIYLQNVSLKPKHVATKRKIRLINEYTVSHFQALLKDETWDTVFKSTCVNDMYNKFQVSLLRHYEASFPICYVKDKSTDNNRITKGIKSSAKKRKLYSEYINIKDDIQIINCYRKYCKVLRKVINEAKNSTFTIKYRPAQIRSKLHGKL